MTATSSRPSLTLAQQHSQRGDHAASERVCRQVLQFDPDDPLVWLHLGTSCLLQNKLAEAEAAYEGALKRQPVFPEATNNLAVVFTRQSRFSEAIQTFHQALQQRPKWAEPRISLGNLLINLQRLEEAEKCFVEAVQFEPGSIEAQNLLGGVLGKQGRSEEAKVHFLEALRLNPRFDMAHSNYVMALNYDPFISPQTLLLEHRWWDRLHGRGLSRVAPFENNRDPDRRPLRIGYVSPDFRQHVVPRFIMPILESHDHHEFQVFGYAQVPQPDETTQRLKSLCNGGWRSTVRRTDAQVIEQILADRIDILVDLAGHTGGNRLTVFAHRPAPVQISYLGYSGTTGLSSIQYQLTDSLLDPPGYEAHYSEELVRLEAPWCCYAPPAEAPAVKPPPSAERGYVTFGLLHKLPKLNSEMLDLWCEVMRATPNSRVIVFRNTLEQSTKDRLTKEFSRRGIDAGRLELQKGSAKNAAHLAMYEQIDVSLDSLPWSGHATTCESLWMGVPMVTLRGDRHASRMSAGILTSVGLTDLIADSREQFVQIATSLAGDRDKLIQLRSELRERMKASKLCDAAGFTRRLEQVYRDLWKRWCASSL